MGELHGSLTTMPEPDEREWLDKTSLGAVGILILDDHEQMTVELVDFDVERDELVVDVISPGVSCPDQERKGVAIPAGRVVSFEPQPRAEQPWPHSDPCRGPSSWRRRLLLISIFLTMIVGGFVLFLVLVDRPYGTQAATAFTYTLFEAFFTFSASKGFRRYLFTCPAVQPEIPLLIRRHFSFLIALFLLQTALLATRPNLPVWWTTREAKGATPFELAMLLICFTVAYTQLFTSRAALKRAHLRFGL